MNSMRSLAILSVITLGLLSQSCTSTQEHINTGYLSNYEELTPSKEFDNALIYVAPELNKAKLLEINKILVEDFELWLKPEQLQALGSDGINDLIVYFSTSLRKSLSEYYHIVDTPDAQTLVIRGAFSNIEVSSPELSPTDFIPFRIVVNAGNAAYLQGTDQQELVSRVGIEVEFRMGEDKQLLFAMTSTKNLDSVVADDREGNTQAVKKLLDTWVGNFTAKIREIHLKP